MRPDVEAATERVLSARARLGRAPERDDLSDDVEDALCEGYAQALAGDAWLTDGERRLHELIDDTSLAFRGREVRELAREHADFQRQVINLRYELEALRREHDRLRSRSSAA